MDPEQELTARDPRPLGPTPAGWHAAGLRRGAFRPRDRPRDRRRREREGADRFARRRSWSRSSTPRFQPRRASPADIPPSGHSRHSGSRSTRSWNSSTRAAAGVGAAGRGRLAGGDLLPLAGGSARERFLAARAPGCICPPDLPVCGCGRMPEAELLTAARSPRRGRARSQSAGFVRAAAGGAQACGGCGGRDVTPPAARLPLPLNGAPPPPRPPAATRRPPPRPRRISGPTSRGGVAEVSSGAVGVRRGGVLLPSPSPRSLDG